MFKTYGALADNLSFGNPNPWKIHHTPTTISIIPNLATWRFIVILSTLMCSFALISALVLIFWALEFPLAFFLLPGLMSFAVGIPILLTIMQKAALKSSNILLWDLSQGRIELPNENLTLHQTQILQIEIISGWWGKDGKNLGYEDSCSQLQLIAEIDNTIHVFPLIASDGTRSLDKEAQTLAARLPIPVFRIRQHMGFFMQRKEDSIEQLESQSYIKTP